ncbi:uncharacterized protein FIESC28_02557 [Fusarium coffeatum]|uniref:Uncharacterized protein n=1 Tax=Fusarium coffeatum TaxID=231269 RepID=A0A366S5M9_9HYPO|nr:uncharacterized protein FIESC28_02557 [Fusarium coffeatum]RBR24624.1 hypothetical protein FIESC28_02557 [Fusarium coffeatum]
MATEAAVDKAADATASQSQPAPDAHNVDPVRSNLNGSAGNDDIENKHITSVEDQLTSADASASGGSDTEASRADGSKSKDEDKGHGRAGSTVKKPATFKSVSVNKTFLATKAAANSASAKVAEKQPAGSSTPPTSSATLSSSRPRLIAKTGSSTRDSSPRLSGGVNGGKPGSVPDASAVWNKNRPVPPPEPKKFTDEELKKYGIHMASRLNEDDAQGQNKWADIDDDDDDWAPEAITWGDGTKTTLPHPDEHPPPPSDSGSVASKGKTFEKPRSPAPPISVSSPLTKSSNLAQGKGLVLKSGSQDKPTLVAKPPAPPAPVKSPWATLPPVEKASPITENASLARPPFNKGMTPPPPKEIAADDFNRHAWRDSAPHGNRELYNSHSGRYEPVQDNRRGSMRMEQHPRHHPSLLQRPPQPDYPAEPSGAFQTNRNTQEPPFGRRRGSSNVSGGSGSFARMNKGGDGSLPPPELHDARRPSFVGSVDSPLSPNLSNSAHGPTRGQHQPNWMPPRASPNPAFAQPHNNGPLPEQVAGPPPPVHPAGDEVEYQKKLMRERVELARKRRQEEEAREEAERRERIQKKLDAMGPAPEKKTEKKESVDKSEEVVHPTHIQQRESPGVPTQTSAQAQTDGDHSATIQQPQDPDGKIGHSPQGPGAAARRVSHSQEAKPTELWGAAAASRQDRAVSTWGTGSQPVARNVWGSPNNDRGLGNGTFNTDIGRLPLDDRPGSQGSKGPSPIAPPHASQQPPQGRQQPPAPIGSGPSRYGASGPRPPQGSDVASKWGINAVSENDRKMSAERLAEKVERDRQLAERGLTLEDAQPVIKNTWRQVHAPGDGTRQSVGPQDSQSAGPWRTAGDEIHEDPASIGAVGGMPGAAASQGRTSRFFPTRDSYDRINENEPSRSKSPTPPPPTMEGHPAYEGNADRPHVSLPRPQPVVRLPPSLAASQTPASRVQFGWAQPPSFKDVARGPVSPNRLPLAAGETSQEKWQNRINSLLGSSRSPPQRSIGVDPASKSALDQVAHHDSATVSLPGNNAPAHFAKGKSSPVSKPMAEECFEEQEMGSLPQIRLPHKAPEAAWQPAPAQNKPLPKKFTVQPTVMEPYYFAAEVVGGGNAMRIRLPEMKETKIVTVPFSATRGGRGSSNRGGPRSRGPGYERRGGKRDVSSSRGEHPAPTSSRGGRGSYRGRGSDWGRSNSASLTA